MTLFDVWLMLAFVGVGLFIVSVLIYVYLLPDEPP